MSHRMFVAVVIVVACSSSNSSTPALDAGADGSSACNSAGITAYGYLMAFHACDNAVKTCSNPQNHSVYLAGSNDGASWTLISAFQSFAASVPDVVYYNGFLYIFYANPNGTDNWKKVNACFQVLETGTGTLVTDGGFGWVDPSLIVSGSDLILFYLPGVFGQDPASCASYPCTKTIRSAKADSAALTSFTQVAGERAQVTLDAGGFSDPDIVSRNDGGSYLLYVSSGPNTMVFTGTTLNGLFTSPDVTTPRTISENQGGVPSAIEAPDGGIWLYVATNQGGVEVVRRAYSADGVTKLDAGSFATVLSYSVGAGFSSQTSVSSPSVMAWPPATWSRVSP